MKNKKETVPTVNPATENETAAALAVIITVLGEAIENNREQMRFAESKEDRNDRKSELAELFAALVWAESAAGKGKGESK